MKLRPIIRGILGYVPLLLDTLKNRKENSGTLTARYCYSVWMRHMVLLTNAGFQGIPKVVAEIGPGASLGIGIAALLSGVDKYYALDVIKHANTERNKKIFFDLVKLFQDKSPIPDENEFPSIKPLLTNYDFPSDILSNSWLSSVLQNKRLNLIEQNITGEIESDVNVRMIEYYVPWYDESVIHNESVDLILSQAVMEHVLNLENSYATMNKWLKRNGYISHQIDFKAHETSNIWYGHRVYSDFFWNIIMKGRSYPINRSPYIVHKKIIENLFKIVFEKTNQFNISDKVDKFNKRFKEYNIDDLSVAEAYIIAKK